MATLFTCEEALEQILAESDGSESDFGSSDSEEESIESSRVYGFPNDRDGNAFAIVREDEAIVNDEADAEGSDFTEENEIIEAEDGPEIAFVDEFDSDILVASHNVGRSANSTVAVPEQRAGRQTPQQARTARQRQNVRQRNAGARPELNLQWEKGNVRNSIPTLVKDQALLGSGEVFLLLYHIFSYFGAMICLILFEYKQIRMLKSKEMPTQRSTNVPGKQ